MKNNELFTQIKSAAENAETKDFQGMEKIWNRVEEKLDNKEDRKAMLLWKKIAVAASLLLVTTLGYQVFKNNPKKLDPNEVVTVTDTIKKITPAPNEVVTTAPKNPIIKKDAEQILKKQIKPETQVALEENSKADDNVSATLSTNPIGYLSAPAASESSVAYSNLKSDKESESKDVELFINKNGKKSNVKKEEPLVVLENKVSKRKLENIEFTEADSLVVLNEPLYIINGIEYSEKEVFGPNPTSPYTPLNKQEIETLSILQNEKAIEIYGDKGKKGVVIITIKNRKPSNANITASKKAK